MRAIRVILIATASLIIQPAPLSAQMFGTIAGQTAMNNVIMANVNQRGQRNAHAEEERKSGSPSTPQIGAVNFNYTPSKPLRAKNMNDFIASLNRTDPQAASGLRSMHAQNDLIELIDRELRSSGLRASNVADAYTVWWITAWQAVNGRDVQLSSRLSQSVKSQVEGAMSAPPQFANLNAAQKQTFAESLLIQTLMIESAKNNPALTSELPKAINQGAKSMGLDLTKMTLTEDGFVPRNGGRSDASDGSDDTQLAANDAGGEASAASFSDYALYAAAGTGLLAGVFAIGKGLTRRG